MPQPEGAQSRRPGRHRVPASGRPGLVTPPGRREWQGCTVPLRPPSATHGRAGGGSLRAFGTPGLLFRTRGRARSRGEAAFPHARRGSGRLGADGELGRTEKSCSEGRRRWVVGGGGGWGRRSPSYLQSRKYSAAQLTEPGDQAASAASRAPVLRLCGEPRYGAPAWSPQPARRDQCA